MLLDILVDADGHIRLSVCSGTHRVQPVSAHITLYIKTGHGENYHRPVPLSAHLAPAQKEEGMWSWRRG